VLESFEKEITTEITHKTAKLLSLDLRTSSEVNAEIV
jgi:hypothetical protein